MADTYEKNLAQKSSLTTSDYIRVVGSDNVSYKQPVSSVMQTMGVVPVFTESASNVTCASGTWTTVISQTFDAGTWIVIGCTGFGTSNTGIRVAMLTVNSTDATNNYDNSVLATGRADLEKVKIFRSTGSFTVYLRVFQNSGSSMTVSGGIRAVRLNPTWTTA